MLTGAPPLAAVDAHVAAPLPPDEAERLAVLHSFGMLDTPAEERFDALTRLAADLCDAPVALMTLLDGERQWFKSAVGTDIRATPRELAFCAYALLDPTELLVVPDLTRDRRFAGNPLVVGEPRVRAYAGAPLVGRDGQPLGTLCVLDTEPRPFDERQLRVLRTLSDQVVAQLEVSRSERRLGQAEQALRLSTGRSRPTEADVPGLERALDNGELVVHYQPFFDVEVDRAAFRARVSGAEALVRWQHPERGLLPPGAFVPAMEACGLASRLGEVVLHDVVQRLAEWDRAGLLPAGFRTHANLAAQQLHEGRVGELVDALGEAADVDPARLCLEVTESALLDADAFTPLAARELVERGVTLALDDFGTGYSSLTQLRSYPFSCVKVDRSFVAGLGVNHEDEVIVDTVVSLARRLGIAPVCEGVETRAQLERVLAAGCATVQGWLFGRATPPEHWTGELLRSGDQVLLRSGAGSRAHAFSVVPPH